MKFYFNRTRFNIFDDPYASEAFYKNFFETYNIGTDNLNYLHFYDESVHELYKQKTIFFSKNKIIIFDAQLVREYKTPFKAYSIEIYDKKDIKSIKINCDGCYLDNYKIIITLYGTDLDFDIKTENYNEHDCKQAIQFLSGLFNLR